MADALRLENTTLRLGAFTLGPLSLCLEQGTYWVLLGESGCGKTTLLRLIAGVYAPDAGAIHLGGVPVNAMPLHARGVGYVSQASDLFPHLTVAENIRFGLAYADVSRGEQDARVEKLVGLLGISHLLARYPRNLSGGEGKRVALARSLAINPRILLLDEPLGMLDPRAREELLAVLRRMHTELGTTTIHVTHDHDEAWNIGDRCAVMERGAILQDAPVATLFRQPVSRRVASFLGAVNLFAGTVRNHILDLGWARFPAQNERGCIWIRPEMIEALPAADASAIAQATVASSIDKGAYREAWLQVDQGPRLRMRGQAVPATGVRVGIRLRTSPLWLEDDDA